MKRKLSLRDSGIDLTRSWRGALPSGGRDALRQFFFLLACYAAYDLARVAVRGREAVAMANAQGIINAEKARFTGKKEENKVYRHFTGYPGGLVETSLKRVRAEKPTRIVEDAIFGMLPKTKLGKQMIRKLQVYAGDKHPHAAQKPVALAVK